MAGAIYCSPHFPTAYIAYNYNMISRVGNLYVVYAILLSVDSHSQPCNQDTMLLAHYSFLLNGKTQSCIFQLLCMPCNFLLDDRCDFYIVPVLLVSVA